MHLQGWQNIPGNTNNTDIFQGIFQGKSGQQIMLNTDMSLAFAAATGDSGSTPVGYVGQVCGPNSFNSGYGCSNGTFGLGASSTIPSTYSLVSSYNANNSLFLQNFAVSFAKMVSVGYGVPANIDGTR